MNQQILKQVLGFTPPSEINTTPVAGGLFNNVYKVSLPNGGVIIKEYVDKNVSSIFAPPQIPAVHRARIAYEVQELASEIHPESVPQVILDEKSNTLYIKEVLSATVLHQFLTGLEIVPDVINKILKFLASFHEKTLTKVQNLEPFFSRMTDFRDYKLKLQYLDLSSMVSEKIRPIILALHKNYPHGHSVILHGDPNSANILIDQDTNPQFIDFEQSHLGHPYYDVTYILSEFFIFDFVREGSEKAMLLQEGYLAQYKSFAGSLSKNLLDEIFWNHLFVQVLYRLFGPSRAKWSGHLSSEQIASIKSSCEDHLLIRNLV